MMESLAAQLNALAHQGKTVSYGKLALACGLRIGALTAQLEAMMEQDAATKQPLRAALCEGKLSQGLPARGFFAKAAELGLDVSDPAAFVADQRAKLYGMAG